MVVNPADSIMDRIQDAHQMLVKLASRYAGTGENTSDVHAHESAKTESEHVSGFDINTLA